MHYFAQTDLLALDKRLVSYDRVEYWKKLGEGVLIGFATAIALPTVYAAMVIAPSF